MLLGSAGGGSFDLRLPAGWRPAVEWNTGDYAPGGAVEGAPLSVEAGGVRAHVELQPGEFRHVTATGTLSGYGTPLRVRATSDGQQVTGTVSNDLGVALHQVTVMVHNATVVIGTVPPRSERPFAVGSVLHAGMHAGLGSPPMMSAETEYWPRTGGNSYYGYSSAYGGPGKPTARPCQGFCPPGVAGAPAPSPDHADAINAPMWTAYSMSRPVPLRRAGAVNVVGWTRELASPLTLDGAGPVTRGRTALVARGAVEPDPAAPFDSVGARFEEVRGASMRQLDPDVDPVEALVVGPIHRMVVPPGMPAETIVIEPPHVYKRLAVSSAGGWKVTPETAGAIRYRLAPEDVVDGTVYFQVRRQDWETDSEHTDPYRGWRLRAAEAGEELTPAVPAAEAGG
jgi:hypothetical protein